MKIKRFKLREGVTKDELMALGFKPGGSWIKKDAELFLGKCFYYKPTNFEYSIDIAFGSNIQDWDDFNNVLVLDDDFGQPYTSFYGKNYGKNVVGFPTLENVIENYNKFLGGLDIFEEMP